MALGSARRILGAGLGGTPVVFRSRPGPGGEAELFDEGTEGFPETLG